MGATAAWLGLIEGVSTRDRSKSEQTYWSTPPIFSNRKLRVTGPVKVVLYASTEGRDTHFVAKLVDVYPDGRAFNMAEGIMRARYRESLS